jgi:hypothetical protein
MFSETVGQMFGLFCLATTVTAVANIRPVAGPLLAPFKRFATSVTDLWCKTIFCARYARHLVS